MSLLKINVLLSFETVVSGNVSPMIVAEQGVVGCFQKIYCGGD